ncbi:hypothetical protein MD484_g6361, partial [Candolleomyces efflorescens]
MRYAKVVVVVVTDAYTSVDPSHAMDPQDIQEVLESVYEAHHPWMRRWLPRPEYLVEDLGKGKENMDFKIQSRLVCQEDEDPDWDGAGHEHGRRSSSSSELDIDGDEDVLGEGRSSSSSKEEAYTLWIKMQVDHLESLYVLQRYLLSKLHEQEHGKTMIRPIIATVISLPRTLQTPESLPQVHVQERSPVIPDFTES